MDDLAKKCIEDHKNPITKLKVPPKKLFIGSKQPGQELLHLDYIKYLCSIFLNERVEKRSTRVQALWVPENNNAKVSKIVKKLGKNFSHQTKEGIFLHPEEMLFLLETNRLEVNWNNTNFTIEEAYKQVINNNISLNKYKIYKSLATLSYKILKNRYSNINIDKSLKRPLLEEEKKEIHNSSKKSKLSEQSSKPEISKLYTVKEFDYVCNVMKSLKEIMPRESKCTENNTDDDNNQIPDYYIFKSNNATKEPDYNLFICDDSNKELLSMNNFSKSNIYALYNDDVAFYKIIPVQIPFIEME